MLRSCSPVEANSFPMGRTAGSPASSCAEAPLFAALFPAALLDDAFADDDDADAVLVGAMFATRMIRRDGVWIKLVAVSVHSNFGHSTSSSSASPPSSSPLAPFRFRDGLDVWRWRTGSWRWAKRARCFAVMVSEVRG